MSGIEIEPGIHPLEIERFQEIYDQTVGGDLDSHVWNGEVKKRIGAYSPSMLAIDGLETDWSDYDSDMDIEDKIKVWTSMPGRPSELSGGSEIFVIAGDNIYAHPEPNTFSRNFLRILTLTGSAYLAYKLSSAFYSAFKEEPVEPEEPPIYDWEKQDELEKEQREYERLTNSRMTRRRFVGMVGGGVAAMATLSADLAASAPFGFLEDAAETVDDKYGELSLDRVFDLDNMLDYGDGRTALLIAKTSDAMERFGLTDTRGSIVLGSGHLTKAGDLLDNPDLRDEYIRQHTRLLLHEAEEDENLFSEPSTVEDRREWAVDTQRRVQIFRVAEPDEDEFRRNARQEIDRSVQLVDAFESPDVISATEGVLDIPRS